MAGQLIHQVAQQKLPYYRSIERWWRRLKNHPVRNCPIGNQSTLQYGESPTNKHRLSWVVALDF